MIKHIFTILLCCISVIGYSQVEYEFYVLESSVDEFDVLGDSEYETNLNIEKNITKSLGVAVGTEVKADSMNGDSFDAKNMIDANMQTAWMSPKKGVNAIIEFYMSIENNKDIHSVTLFQLAFFNGWRKDYQTWSNYSRIKKVALSINDKPYAEITLEDTYKHQYIDLEKLKLEKNGGYRFRFRIMETYPGKIYEQTALSDVQFIGKVK